MTEHNLQVTIVNTMHRHQFGEPISIGRPTPNNNVYILNEQLEPVDVGVPGIMWASGLGVSCGYLNRPNLTAARFQKDPFLLNRRTLSSDHSGAALPTAVGRCMYNTGDLGRWTKNGYIEHLGRVDDQVKVKVIMD